MTNPKITGSGFDGFDAALGAVRARMDTALSAAPPPVRLYTRHLALSQGKFIRAASLLACAQGEGGAIPANAVAFATAVELLHLATLVHDDVIDDADLRRGELTLQKKFDKRSAVICGDYVLCMAMKTAASVPNRADYAALSLTDYIGQVCLGELNQHSNNRNFSLTVYRYLKIIHGKTAALFEGAFYAGAVLCTADERERSRYARLGRYIGMIFQITDDRIDFELDETAAKKPVQSDFEQGVITLPLIHALQSDPDFSRRAQAGEITRPQLNSVVRASGGLDFAGKIAGRYYEKAAYLLGVLRLSDEKRARLTAVLGQAYHGLRK